MQITLVIECARKERSRSYNVVQQIREVSITGLHTSGKKKLKLPYASIPSIFEIVHSSVLLLALDEKWEQDDSVEAFLARN